MRDLLPLIQRHAGFRQVEAALGEGRSCRAEGLWGSSAACLVAALGARTSRPILCVVPHVEEAEAFAEDLALFWPDRAASFPAWETLEEDEAPDAEVVSERLAVLKRLFGPPASSAEAPIVVAPVQAVVQPVPSPAALRRETLNVRRGEAHPPEEIAAWLTERGFRQVRQVEVPGEFCRRGGILDVFPYAAERPVRVEFFGDEVESVRAFDPATQSSLEEVAGVDISALIRPTGGNRPDHGLSSLFEHLPEDSWVVLKEPAQVMERVGGIAGGGRERLGRACERFATLHLAALPGAFGEEAVTFRVHSVERFGRDLAVTLRELEHVAATRERTIVMCNNAGERERLLELLGASPALSRGGFEVRIGRLNHGFDWTDLSLALLTHHEIFQRYRQRRTPARYRHVRPVDTFYDLEPGDLVVHASHGIGIFRGMELIQRGTAKEECLKIEYADRAFLFVPASRIELVQKYVGPSERRPPLNRLGTRTWLQRRRQAQEAVRDLAQDLLRLQAVRSSQAGLVSPPDTDWQREFEASFPYEETEDQLRVAGEVKADMERPRPMDRLICGDVGYGKTEIAMRAAFKAVLAGRQVAVLVPTTVLAAQHTETFRERMADYPIVVEMLSRFLTRSEQQDVLERLAQGRVDIVIGTHRLIQPDVRFKDLGLVIVDEEQRFGVEHKERLKRLRETVDVLTLTATPIPRTLHLSLVGLRDISPLETPPRDRLAIHTRLMRFDPGRIRQAILHELARDGQVFFVHNRVESIQAVAQRVRELVPEARVVVGHGQMPERELARVMREFVEGRADVLVCTTIIESGLDIPNANTIIINQADRFGLAELHQLRGRGGRYKHRAYAYLLVPDDRPVTPAAEKRLKAIEEFCELGAGFRIAMRDLEIRGAGNLLGPEQSGHLAAVGYDMYCRLLERAIRELRNEPLPDEREVTLSLGLEAFLPEGYVPDLRQRIDLYRRLHRAASPEDLDALAGEMRDRFGPLPPQAVNLLAEARLRLVALRAGVLSMRLHDGAVTITSADPSRVEEVLSAAGLAVRRVDQETLRLVQRGRQPEGMELVAFLTQALERGLRSPASGVKERV